MMQLGKVLVFVNLAFSLIMASWAGALYANRLDWSDTAPKADQPPGELYKRDQRFQELSKGFEDREVNFTLARSKLRALEEGLTPAKEEPDKSLALRLDGRSAERLWYARELQQLYLLAALPGNPARVAVFTGGVPRTTPGPNGWGRPTMAPFQTKDGKSLSSLARYDDQEGKLLTELTDPEQGLYRKLSEKIDEDAAEARKLVGPKGLQNRLTDEKLKRDAVLDELKLLIPLHINTMVETRNLIERRQQLEERITELKKPRSAPEKR
jgi:hypothetical protein